MRKFLIPFTVVLAASLSLASAAEGKSLWQSFVAFFSPDEEPQGEGPLYRQLADLDRDIHKNEQAYSRERRPQKKAYLKSHIEDLRKEREALVAKIKAEEAKSSSGSAQVSAASAASAPGSSSSARSAPAASSASAYSSAAPQSSSSVPAPEVVTAKQPMLAYVFRDTVFVRDTVIVRDTVFIPSPCAPDSLQRQTQTSR